MLAIVEHEQEILAPQIFGQRLLQSAAGFLTQAESRSHDADHCIRLGDGGQLGHPDAIEKIFQ